MTGSVQLTLLWFQILSSGIATVSILGSGVGIGIIFGSLILGVSYNTSVKDTLFGYAILGFALTEAIALFGLMMAFLILFGEYADRIN